MFGKSVLVRILLITISSSLASSLNAAYLFWSGAIGDWSDSSNWSGTEPTAQDYASITNTGIAMITQSGEACRSLGVGGNPGYDMQGMVIMTHGSLNTSSLSMGSSGQGYFKQSGGLVSGSSGYISDSYLGGSTGAYGEYNLTGGELNSSREYIGYSGVGVFNQSGGKNVAPIIYIGEKTNSSGQYNLSGTGQLTTNDLYIGSGSNSTGYFKQTGGNCTITNTLHLAGNNQYLIPTYTLDGAGTLQCRAIEINGKSCLEWFSSTLTTNGFILSSSGLIDIGFDFDVNALITGSLYHGTASNFQGSTLEITRNATATHNTGNLTSFGTLNVGTMKGAGTYTLSGNAQLSATGESIGLDGIGTFVQTGGTNSVNGIVSIGTSKNAYYGESYGKYTLTGTGILATSGTYNRVFIRRGRFEWFRSGGLTTTALYVDYQGTLAMGYDFDMVSLMNKSLFNGSTLKGIDTSSSSNEGYHGNLEITNGATATHSGTAVWLACLSLGSSTGNGIYKLSGTANLNATGMEQIGYDGNETGLFQQTGGTNTVELLSIGKSGRYELNGGTLTLGSGFQSDGVLDCMNSSAMLSIPGNSVLDMSKGIIINAKNIALNVPATSILIVAPGFNPSTVFKTYSNSGILHTTGTPLVIDAGKSYGGFGKIDDPVTCSGTLKVSFKPHTNFGYLNLNKGLLVNSGTVDLKYGYLINDDNYSGISNGSLSVNKQYIGKAADGIFNQLNGTNSVTQELYLGYAPGISGTYTLNGTGQLTVCHDRALSLAAYEYIGYSGKGTVTQSAGTHNFTGYRGSFYLGFNAGSTGTYNLNGGQLQLSQLTPFDNTESFFYEYIGYSGTGVFNQSAGVHNFGPYGQDYPLNHKGMYIGYNSGSVGIYNLTGTGQLTTGDLSVGYNSDSQGELNIADQATATLNNLYLGQFGGSKGKLTVTNSSYPGISIYNNLFVGYSGSGEFTQSGGFVYINNLVLGCNADSNGVYSLTGGQLSTAGIVKGLGTATLNLGGGTLYSLTISMPITLTGINGNVTLDCRSDMTISGVITGPGGIIKLPDGRLTLKAKAAYQGDTLVQGGMLNILGGIDADGTKLIDVQKGATVSFDQTNINAPSLSIRTTGTAIFQVVNGTHTLGSVLGTGTTHVGNQSILNATSIVQNTLWIGDNLYAISASTSSEKNSSPVPEPAGIVMLGIVACGVVLAGRRWWRG